MNEDTAVSRFIQPRDARAGLAQALLDIVGQVPSSRLRRVPAPATEARRLARQAQIKASTVAGGLALAPGPLGWLTIAPELYAVWKIQARLVSDIAAAHGQHRQLRREEMLYCLFQHTAAGAFRDIVIQVGERYVVRHTPLSALYAVANKIALRIAQRGIMRAGARWLPVAGAAAVAGFVLLDTRRVAATAVALFGHDRVDAQKASDADMLPPRATAVPARRKRGSRPRLAAD